MKASLTIKIFDQPAEASAAQSLLASEGIASFLKEDTSGGAALQVQLKDAKRSVSLLLAQGYLKADEIQSTEEEDEALITITIGKKYERVFRYLLILLMAALIIGLYYFFSRRYPAQA